MKIKITMLAIALLTIALTLPAQITPPKVDRLTVTDAQKIAVMKDAGINVANLPPGKNIIIIGNRLVQPQAMARPVTDTQKAAMLHDLGVSDISAVNCKSIVIVKARAIVVQRSPTPPNP